MLSWDYPKDYPLIYVCVWLEVIFNYLLCNMLRILIAFILLGLPKRLKCVACFHPSMQTQRPTLPSQANPPLSAHKLSTHIFSSGFCQQTISSKINLRNYGRRRAVFISHTANLPVQNNLLILPYACICSVNENA